MEWDEYGKRIASLARRLEGKIARQKAIQLSADELRLLCACGAYEVLALSAARQLRRESWRALGLPVNEQGEPDMDSAPGWAKL